MENKNITIIINTIAPTQTHNLFRNRNESFDLFSIYLLGMKN